jgi:hypothetical protein
MQDILRLLNVTASLRFVYAEKKVEPALDVAFNTAPLAPACIRFVALSPILRLCAMTNVEAVTLSIRDDVGIWDPHTESSQQIFGNKGSSIGPQLLAALHHFANGVVQRGSCRRRLKRLKALTIERLTAMLTCDRLKLIPLIRSLAVDVEILRPKPSSHSTKALEIAVVETVFKIMGLFPLQEKYRCLLRIEIRGIGCTVRRLSYDTSIQFSAEAVRCFDNQAFPIIRLSSSNKHRKSAAKEIDDHGLKSIRKEER